MYAAHALCHWLYSKSPGVELITFFFSVFLVKKKERKKEKRNCTTFLFCFVFVPLLTVEQSNVDTSKRLFFTSVPPLTILHFSMCQKK